MVSNGYIERDHHMTTTVELYSAEDEASMLARIPEMMADGDALRNAHVAPTTHQRLLICETIWDFVAKKGRKIYGGHALNAALLATSPEDAIYPMPGLPGQPGHLVCHDIEFYSPDPLPDVIELANRLFVNGFRYVQAREAAHLGTFTISVEFTRVCDVTFVPHVVFESIPVRRYGGVVMIDPTFAIMDHLKIITDPFTSYWKLDKMLPRMMLIQRIFPMTLPTANPYTGRGGEGDVLEKIFQWAASRPAPLVLVGDHAAAFYYSFSTTKHTPRSHVTLVSSGSFSDDIIAFQRDFKKNNDIKGHKERYPLCDTLGRTCVFYLAHGHGTAVTFVDARDRAIPICGRCPKTGLCVASVSYSLLVALGQRHSAEIHNLISEAQIHAQTAARIIDSRTKGLKDLNTTTADASCIYRDVNLSYFGQPKSSMRTHMEATDDRRIISAKNKDGRGGGNGAQVWFSYDPSRPPVNRAQHKMYVLLRCDGGLVINPRDSKLIVVPNILVRQVQAQEHEQEREQDQPTAPVDTATAV